MRAATTIAALSSSSRTPAVRGFASSVSGFDLLRQNVGLEQLSVNVTASAKAELFVPASQDELLNLYITHEADMGGLTPYYGVVWPSALALCQHLEIPAQSDVLELGSGVGLGGIAAALTCSPNRVLMTDIDPIAVELAKMGSDASGVGDICECACLDWNAIESWPSQAFDCVIAADVIYEPEACDSIARLLGHVLRPGGTFVLADGKGRVNRERLWQAMLGKGEFEVSEDERVVFAPPLSELGEARGRLDRELRSETEQPVVLATFERQR